MARAWQGASRARDEQRELGEEWRKLGEERRELGESSEAISESSARSSESAATSSESPAMSPRALVEWSRKNIGLVVECNTPVLHMHLAHRGGSPRALVEEVEEA
jgi:hypothetical protein